jgi:adenosine deaminase
VDLFCGVGLFAIAAAQAGVKHVLGVERIDHGVQCLQDPELVRLLAAKQIPLTVCPLSNLKLCVIDDIAQSPVKRMLDAGISATVNSDDPAYFGGYVNENYRAIASALDLSRDELRTLAANSFRGSFLDEAAKAHLLAEIDHYDAHFA